MPSLARGAWSGGNLTRLDRQSLRSGLRWAAYDRRERLVRSRGRDLREETLVAEENRMNVADLRAATPALEEITYLNFGATGPSPRPVVEAMSGYLERHEYEAPIQEGVYPMAFETYENARESIAGFIGSDQGDVALTHSTADGIGRFIGAMDWEPGDVVVRTDMEHPAVNLPLERLARHHDVEIRVLESEEGHLDEAEVIEGVRGADLVVLSAVTWTHGTRLSVADYTEIAHAAGATVLVDAVQAVGHVPVDMRRWGADAVAASGHKWLLGPWGSGFLYVDGAVAADLEPGMIGYRGVVDSSRAPYELEAGAARFEIGTANPAPHVGVSTAIDLMEDIGQETITDRILARADRLVDGLPDASVVGPARPESGLVTIGVDDPEAAVDRLAEAGFVLRSLPEPAAIRASVHALNTTEEIDGLIDAIDDLRQ